MAAIERPLLMPGDFQSRFGADGLIEAHHSLFIYHNEGGLSRMLRRGKYDGAPAFITALADMLTVDLMMSRTLTGVDALVPVPMHWFKQMRRGYNQTHLIALTIGRAAHIPMVKALRATRAHAHLAGSSAEDRIRAVRGLFAPVSNIILSGKRVAIVDDVLTTGSTLRACAEAAKRGGAQSVISITLATAPGLQSVIDRY